MASLHWVRALVVAVRVTDEGSEAAKSSLEVIVKLTLPGTVKIYRIAVAPEVN